MDERRDSRDRRSEPRQVRAGRIRWRREGDFDPIQGWLSDVATNSVSFITASHRGPGRGERLEVQDGMTRNRYEVVRVTPFDENLTLVACQRAPQH